MGHEPGGVLTSPWQPSRSAGCQTATGSWRKGAGRGDRPGGVDVTAMIFNSFPGKETATVCRPRLAQSPIRGLCVCVRAKGRSPPGSSLCICLYCICACRRANPFDFARACITPLQPTFWAVASPQGDSEENLSPQVVPKTLLQLSLKQKSVSSLCVNPERRRKTLFSSYSIFQCTHVQKHSTHK